MSVETGERGRTPADVDSATRRERLLLTAGTSENLTAVVGGVLILGLCFGFFLFAGATDPDTWVPVAVVAFLVVLSVPICYWASGKPPDRRLRRLLLVSFALKMMFVGPRYYLIEGYYKGEGDALRYDQAGDALVQNVARGEFSIKGTELDAFPKETRVVGYITGLLYLVFGTSYLGGYMVFSWMAWLGMLFSFRAFQIAYPNAPPYRAFWLIMFLPSMLFWPSSLGKDALMVFLVGLLTLGAARLLTGRKAGLGIAWVLLAGGLMLQIRPHLLLIAAVALAGSQLARSPTGQGRRGVIGRIVLLTLLVPVLAVGLSRLDSTLNTDDNQGASLDQSLESTIARTEIGGSAFTPAPVRTPLDLPFATVTVLYRPFAFEARSVAVLISAAEGTLLLVMTAVSIRWLWRIGPAMYGSPFGAFCGTFVLGFIIAFSNIANAGILSRQRTQMFPALMLIACAGYELHRLAGLQSEPAALPAAPEVGPPHRPARTAPVPT